MNKDEILESILLECDVARHLVGKVPAGGDDYRQSEGQRTNLEVARYLAFCGIGGTLAMIEGGWDSYQAWSAKVEDLSMAEIPGAIDAQKAALVETFAGLTDADLAREVTHPMGHTMTLERSLLEIPLKWLTGYRMQLFLGAKAAGNDDIWTPDCWMGVSKPRDTQPAG